jgi:hypothetical protein
MKCNENMYIIYMHKKKKKESEEISQGSGRG